jgi:20S proteasome subunit alpha 5
VASIQLGATAIGVQVESGVVLAVEKRISSSLLIPSSLQKILEIDAHVGAASSGLAADASTLIEHARVEAQNHWYVVLLIYYSPPNPCFQSGSFLCVQVRLQ